MAFGTLTAKLALDASQYEAGINRAKKTSLDFAANLERSVGNKLRNLFGLGIITGGIAGIKSLTFGAAAEFQQLADSAGMTVSQMLKVQEMADSNGISFEKMAEKIRESGQSLDEFTNTIIDSDQKLANRVSSRFSANLRRVKQFGIHALSGMEMLFNGDPDENTRSAGLGKLRGSLGRSTGEQFGPANPFTTPLNGFELSRQSFMPNVNALQSIGAGTRQEATTTELKTLVQLTRDSNFTLKKIEQKTDSESNLGLEP